MVVVSVACVGGENMACAAASRFLYSTSFLYSTDLHFQITEACKTSFIRVCEVTCATSN